MLQKNKVHQIWVGPKIPELEEQWSAEIKKASTAAGWQYTLYRLQELLEALPGDKAMARLAEYCALCPNAQNLGGIVSDYARYALLVKYGGLYLDTDWEYVGMEWPTFPTENTLWGAPITEKNQGQGILWCPLPVLPDSTIIKLQKLAASKVWEYFPELEELTIPIPEFLKQLPRVTHFVGPDWLFQVLGPILKRLPTSIAKHYWQPGESALIHRAHGRWR